MMALRERGHTLEAICQPASKLSSRLQAEGFRVHEFLMDGMSNYTGRYMGSAGSWRAASSTSSIPIAGAIR